MKVKTQILLMLSFMLIIGSVSASQYTYNLQTEFNQNIQTGNSTFGRLIFFPIITNITTHNITSANSNINILKSDIVCNKLNNTINIINKTILLANQCSGNLNIGTYHATSNNLTFSIIVIDAPHQTINITSTNYPFKLTYNKVKFILHNDTEILVNISLPTDLLPGLYTTKYKINDIENTQQFNVIQTMDWGYQYKNVTDKLIVGSDDSIGNFTVTNLGNSFTTISIDSDCDFLGYPSKILSYANVPVKFGLNYNLDKNALLGNRTCGIDLIDLNGIKKQLVLNLTIIDKTKPIITNVTFSDKLEATRPFSINAEISDNSYLDKILLKIDGYNDDKPINITLHDTDYYQINLTLPEIRTYKFNLTVTDKSGNVQSYNAIKDFGELDSIEYSKTLSMPKQRIDKWATKRLLFSDVKTNVTIKLADMIYEHRTMLKNDKEHVDKGDYEIKFETSDDTYVIHAINDTVEFIDFIGNLTMSVNGDMVTTYSGKLELNGSEIHKPLKTISFDGEFMNYTIPEDWTDNYGIDGMIEVNYFNVDDYDSSGWKAIITGKGLPGKDELSVPMTIEIKDQLITVYIDKINELKSQKLFWVLLSVFFILSVMAIMFISLYKVNIKPTNMMMIKLKDKDLEEAIKNAKRDYA